MSTPLSKLSVSDTEIATFLFKLNLVKYSVGVINSPFNNSFSYLPIGGSGYKTLLL